MSDSEKYCSDLLNDFIQEKLEGDLNNLKKFSFFQLYEEKNKKYGFDSYPKDVWQYDPDSSKIANSIYFLLWKDKLPELRYEQIGSNYRGDTLNTFKSLFGRDYYIAKEMLPNDFEFYGKIEKFKNIYLSIGNFSLLPNEVPIGYNKRSSINCYRGKKWKDFYEIFLYELDLCLLGSTQCDAFLKCLINSNSFYFSKINSIKKFKEINYLEGYFSTGNKVLTSLKDDIKNGALMKPESYRKLAIDYISKATKIIRQRADIIIENLNVIFEDGITIK